MKSKLEEAMARVPRYAKFTYANMEHDKEDPADEGDERMPKKVAIVLSFSEPGFGFGEITLIQNDKGQLFVDTECTGKLMALRFFLNALDDAITDQNMTPSKHKLYNEVMGRTCSSDCEVCNKKT